MDTQALIASMVGVHFGTPPPVEDTRPIHVVLADGKVYEERRSALFTSITEGTTFGANTKVTPGLTVHKRLPWALLQQIVAFFREVHTKYNSEAIVRLYVNNDGVVIPVVPKQDVSGGTVKHNDEHHHPEGFLRWGDIHSHHTMGAFWSPTDNNDESKHDGCLFGVIGNINDAWPSMKFRAVLNGKFVDIPAQHLVEDVRVPVARMMNAQIGYLLDSRGKIEYKADVNVETTGGVAAAFPPEWMDQVEHHTYRHHNYTPHKGYTLGASSSQTSSGGWTKRHNPLQLSIEAGLPAAVANKVRWVKKARKADYVRTPSGDVYAITTTNTVNGKLVLEPTFLTLKDIVADEPNARIYQERYDDGYKFIKLRDKVAFTKQEADEA